MGVVDLYDLPAGACGEVGEFWGFEPAVGVERVDLHRIQLVGLLLHIGLRVAGALFGIDRRGVCDQHCFLLGSRSPVKFRECFHHGGVDSLLIVPTGGGYDFVKGALDAGNVGGEFRSYNWHIAPIPELQAGNREA